MTEHFDLPVVTQDGVFQARYSGAGLCRLRFPAGNKNAPSEVNPAQVTAEIRQWHRVTIQAVTRALKGQMIEELPPLDLTEGTDFQRRVWKVMLKIGRGQTLSYAAVAEAIGKPK